MRITNLSIGREPMDDGNPGIVCRATLVTGEQLGCALPWINLHSYWASDSEERHPAELAACLRQFADAIEKAAELPKPHLVVVNHERD